jgi:hypothetical protein
MLNNKWLRQEAALPFLRQFSIILEENDDKCVFKQGSSRTNAILLDI